MIFLGFPAGGEGFLGYSGQGAFRGAVAGVAPFNLRLPALTGTFVDDTYIGIDVGDWANAVSFEAEIRTGTTNAVAFARQSITTSGPFAVAGIVGEGLFANIWATGPDGAVTLATSPVSPVVTAAEFEFFGAYAFSEINNLPTTPYLWTPATVLPWASRYALGNGFGWRGTSLTNVLNPYNTTGLSEAVLQRVVTMNLSPPALHFIRDVPNGTYDVYTACVCHFPAQTGKVLNVEFWDGFGEVNAGVNFFRGGAASSPVSGQDAVMDAMGTVRTRANHFAVTLPNGDVSPFGGLPRRISVTTGKISVARNGLNNTASNLAYAAFLKVNNP